VCPLLKIVEGLGKELFKRLWTASISGINKWKTKKVMAKK